MGKARVLCLFRQDGAFRELISVLDKLLLDVLPYPLTAKLDELVVALKPDLLFLNDTESGHRSWQETTGEVRRADPTIPLILVTERGSEELAVTVLRLGLQDYLTLPASADAVQQVVNRCLSFRASKSSAVIPKFTQRLDSDGLVGANPALCALKVYMTKVAAADCTVLITGETGTGKELAAEFVHRHSPRKGKPFMCVNSAAIPDPLLESELFGHTKGAFTGAEHHRDGVLAAADGGTVFLDEVGDMSLFAQAKILRVLEKKEVCRLGGTQPRHLDVRFVAATNQDLESMANRGGFRKDLFFRLNVARVHLPPLRERKDDITLIVDHYCREFSFRAGCPAPKLSQQSLACLMKYDWPGNVRELKNMLENLFLGKMLKEVRPEHLPLHLRELVEKSCNISLSERDQVVTALHASGWNKSKAAETLHWSRMTLYRKMAKHQVSRFVPQAASYREERGSKAV